MDGGGPNLLDAVLGLLLLLVALDEQCFPQVFAGAGREITVPPVPTTADAAVRAAVAGGPSTVQVRASGCGGVLGSGSG